MTEFHYHDKNGKYHYIFVFKHDKINNLFFIEAYEYQVNYGSSVWLFQIKDNQIVWRQNNCPFGSDDARKYISKIVKLRAFI